MKQLQLTDAFIKDFFKLKQDFALFMSFNLIYANEKLPEPCASKVLELIRFSTANLKEIQKYDDKMNDKPFLEKNVAGLLDFFHSYLGYAGPILDKCRKDIHDGRYKALVNHYVDFHAKYLQ